MEDNLRVACLVWVPCNFTLSSAGGEDIAAEVHVSQWQCELTASLEPTESVHISFTQLTLQTGEVPESNPTIMVRRMGVG